MLAWGWTCLKIYLRRRSGATFKPGAENAFKLSAATFWPGAASASKYVSGKHSEATFWVGVGNASKCISGSFVVPQTSLGRSINHENENINAS